MIRKLPVVVFGLLLLGCGGVPFAPRGKAPVAPSAPSGRVREAASDFPTAPIENLCRGESAAKIRKIPEDRVDALFTELRKLERRQLIARICATEVRQEVAVGFTLLAAQGDEERYLRIAADTYAEPVALASIGALHATGSKGFVKDDGAANRYRLASAAISRGAGERSGSDALAKRASRASGDDSMANGGQSTIGAPDRDTVAKIQAFVDARVELYEELYIGRDRRTARR